MGPGHKKENSKIQAVEIKFLRAVLNKTMKDRIRNTNIRLKLGVVEIKNDIQEQIKLAWTCDTNERREDT